MGKDTGEQLSLQMSMILKAHQNTLNEIGYFQRTEEGYNEEKNRSDNQIDINPFLLEENHTKLGIPTWALPYLFGFLKIWLLTKRRDIHQYHKELNYFSQTILLVNPSWYPAYAIRKQLMVHCFLGPKDEKKFLNLLLTLKACSKVSACWYHRKWTLLFQEKNEGLTRNNDGLLHELKLGFSFVSRVSRNYTGWEFLSWNLFSCPSKQTDWFIELLLDQLKITCDFIRTNCTESGAYYYMACIFKLFTEQNDPPPCLFSTLSQVIVEIHCIIENYPLHSQSAIYGLINAFGFMYENFSKQPRSVPWNMLIAAERAWLDQISVNLFDESEIAGATFKAYRRQILTHVTIDPIKE